uniref:Nop domain-containing protein n=1 Tax=Dracunculus medinensis TaxID=318479 RepID=A0A0N4UAF1_DRAME
LYTNSILRIDQKNVKKIKIFCFFSIKLVKFKRFDTPLVARDYYLQQKEGNLAKLLKKVLKKQISEGEELAVGDTKLGNIIKEKLNIPCVSNAATTELMRGIRSHIDSLLDEHKDELANMRLALAHSLGRYQVKFNPDKIDTMIIQGISLLDDLDKELNNYIMRCREWYGWHFPELSKIISDPILYVKTVRAIGIKQNAINIDMSEFLSPDLEAKIKSEAEISMGTMISDSDMNCIQYLCEQILDLSDYRAQLSQYLKERMATLAPNLTALLGELVGARLISHAGSLVTLAKYPASTVQILGAEKALFRALKTKKDTPKYGLIYHAQIVGQASTKMKGKMARKLSAKVSLASRIDALADESKGASMGIEARAYLERVSRQGQEPRRISGVSTKHDKYRFKRFAAHDKKFAFYSWIISN